MRLLPNLPGILTLHFAPSFGMLVLIESSGSADDMATQIALDLYRPCTRAVRRRELRKIVPLADTTIYEMECRGEFPQRFYLTSKCVAWDLDEVERWLTARRAASNAGQVHRAPDPDVRSRRSRPVASRHYDKA